MKTQIFNVALLLALTNISLAISIKDSKNLSSKLMLTAGPDQNKFYQLFLGFMFGAAGKVQDITQINTCLPKGWQSADNSEIVDKEPSPDKSTFTKVIDGLEKVINFICTFKDKIIESLSNLIKKHALGQDVSFVQTGSSGAPAAAVASMKEKLKKKWEEVQAKKLKAAEWAKQKWADVTEFGDAIQDKFKEIGFKAVSTILKFFGKGTIDNLLKIVACGKQLKKFKDGLMDVINGIQSKVVLINRIAAQDYTALAELLVGLICNFSVFREAFGYLSSALAEKTQLLKFNMIGKFIGTSFRALST